MVEKMEMFFNKRIVNYVFGSVRRRERDCNNKVSGDKTEQRQNKQPLRQSFFLSRGLTKR